MEQRVDKEGTKWGSQLVGTEETLVKGDKKGTQ